MDSYLITMKEMIARIGELSGKYNYAEGWIKHLHQGLCAVDDDPLTDVLADYVCSVT